jgi:hypothetical protein
MAPVIKSGSEIVNEFLTGLPSGNDLDAATVSAIKTLHSESKLTRTRLEQALERIRAANPNQEE